MRRSWLKSRTAEKITVHTDDERSVEGLLTLVASDGVVLRAARYLEGEGAISLAGELFIPKARITFIQAG